MSEIQLIESAVQRAAKRRRFAHALRGLWQGLLVGAVISLVLFGAYRLLPFVDVVLPTWTLMRAALAPLPCMVIGLAVGGWRKPALNEVARWLDGRQHLQERLSTALEFAKQNATTLSDLVVSDAAQPA